MATRRLPRWYWLLSAAMADLLALAGLITVATALSSQTPDAVVPLPLSPCLVLFLLLWNSWVCPVLDSGDLRPAWRCAPRRRLRSLRRLVWTPTVLCVGIGVCLLALGILAESPASSYRSMRLIERAVLWLMCSVVPGLISLSLSGYLTHDMRRTASRRQVCFDCGYDLRGSPDGDCPECGRQADSTP